MAYYLFCQEYLFLLHFYHGQEYDPPGIKWYLVEYQENTGWVAGKYLKQQANNPNKTIKSFKLVAKKDPDLKSESYHGASTVLIFMA